LPAAVQAATADAIPYSMSSGCAAMISARCQSSGMGFGGMPGSLPRTGAHGCMIADGVSA
jgi:hypothetical protein